MNRLKKLADLGSEIALAEVPQALEQAASLAQLREHAVFQEAVLKRWSALAPAEAFDFIGKLPENRTKVEVIRVAARAFAKQSPASAAFEAARIPAGRSRNEAINMIAENWAETDPKAALKWTSALSGLARESARERVLFVWVHSDPKGSFEEVDKLAPGNIKNALITNIAGKWAAKDPDGAIEWARSLPSGPERELALTNVAESWADFEPASAAAFAMELPDGDLRQQAVVAVARRWATQDPAEAIAWTWKIRDDRSRYLGTVEVLQIWAANEPKASGDWVTRLPSGPERDRIIEAYVEAVNVWAPDCGARIALTAENEIARIRHVEPCIRRWLELDPKSATAWLKQTEISEDLKQRWLSVKLEE